MSTDLLTADPVGEINKYDFQTVSKPVFKARKAVDPEIVRQISEMKDEPEWMRDFRLKALDIVRAKPMPNWGRHIGVNFDDIYDYLKPTIGQGHTCDAVRQEIHDTF